MKLTLDKNLENLLKKNNLNIPKLSTVTAISRQTLANWIAGQKPRNIEQVKIVADFFCVSMEYLCFGEENSPVNPIQKYDNEINAGVYEVVLRKVRK